MSTASGQQDTYSTHWNVWEYVCAHVCVYTLTSPIWMCVSSTDCEYDWMISFMWRMWFSSMSWNFCNTGRGWLWHDDATNHPVASNQINCTATNLHGGVSLRHKNKNKDKMQPRKLHFLILSPPLPVCLFGWSMALTHMHIAPPTRCQLFCSWDTLTGINFLASSSSMV